MTHELLQCNLCAHFRGFNKDFDGMCDAFKVIPYDLMFQKKDHRFPFPGDNEIRWQPIDEETTFPEGLKDE